MFFSNLILEQINQWRQILQLPYVASPSVYLIFPHIQTKSSSQQIIRINSRCIPSGHGEHLITVIFVTAFHISEISYCFSSVFSFPDQINPVSSTWTPEVCCKPLIILIAVLWTPFNLSTSFCHARLWMARSGSGETAKIWGEGPDPGCGEARSQELCLEKWVEIQWARQSARSGGWPGQASRRSNQRVRSGSKGSG